MNDYLDAIRGCLSLSPGEVNEGQKQWFEKAVDFRTEISAISDNFVIRSDNFEDIFGLLEASILAGVEPESSRSQFILAALRTLEIRLETPDTETGNIAIASAPLTMKPETLERCKMFYPENFNQQWLYHAFANLVGRTYGGVDLPDSIITFNYDLLLDRAFFELGYNVNYGLDAASVVKTRVRNPLTNQGVRLYKLHGSANWFICTECKRPFIAQPRMMDRFDERSLLEISMNLNCPNKRQSDENIECGNPGPHTPFIVPPTWNKAAYQTGLEKVWQGAIKAIQNASRIIIIGYSLPETDTFFRFMMNVGVLPGKDTKIMILNPDSDAWSKYSSFMKPLHERKRLYWPGHNQEWHGMAIYDICNWLDRQKDYWI